MIVVQSSTTNTELCMRACIHRSTLLPAVLIPAGRGRNRLPVAGRRLHACARGRQVRQPWHSASLPAAQCRHHCTQQVCPLPPPCLTAKQPAAAHRRGDAWGAQATGRPPATGRKCGAVAHAISRLALKHMWAHIYTRICVHSILSIRIYIYIRIIDSHMFCSLFRLFIYLVLTFAVVWFPVNTLFDIICWQYVYVTYSFMVFNFLSLKM